MGRSHSSKDGRGLRLGFMAMLVLCQAALGQSYSVTLLGGQDFFPFDLNESGVVVGQNGSAGGAFLWENGNTTVLGTLPGHTQAIAYGINEFNQVVGFSGIPGSFPNTGVSDGFLWENGVMTDIVSHTGGGLATGINASGQVVGYVFDPGDFLPDGTYSRRAFLLDGGVTTYLPSTFGGFASIANDINGNGVIVGAAEFKIVDPRNPPGHTGIFHAFAAQNGTRTDLGTLFGAVGDSSYANAINDQGQIVGYSYSPTFGRSYAFIWENGVMTDLGNLGPFFLTSADDINSLGQVVGASGGKAFLWQGGVLTDLNTLIDAGSGWELRRATAVNDAGQIVGIGYHNATGMVTGFLLTPVPEPSTWMGMLIGGLVGFGWYRRMNRARR